MHVSIKTFAQLTTDELYKILKLRSEIFVVEQNCIYLDIDDIDRVATHVFLCDGNAIMAYTRVYEHDAENAIYKIGRVLSAVRNQGFGARIMKESIRVVQEQLQGKGVFIEAQSYAQPFYEKLGFSVCSAEFLEDGIPHKEMQLTL